MAKHTHRYHRVNIATKGKDPHWVMHCSLPNCNHYVHMKTKNSCPQLWGKAALCNRCKDEFILDVRALLMAKPICLDCVQGNVAKKRDAVSQLFKQLEKENEVDITRIATLTKDSEGLP